MGNNYDFRFNEPPLDRERIEQHKDFAALLQKYQGESSPEPKKKRPGLRIVWIGLSTAVAAAIALLLIIKPFGSAVGADELLAAQEAYFAEQAFIQAPIPPAEPAFTRKALDAEVGGTYEMNAGLQLVVPEQAFMDDRGRQITGAVEIAYREMHDPVDFFLSGIPMVYDSMGRHYQMESAGMIEVYGYQNGQRVQLAPGKTIRVELTSRVTFTGADLQEDFRLFYLDTAQRNWIASPLPLEQEIQYQADDTPKANNSSRAARLGVLAQAEANAIAQAEAQLPAPERPIKRSIKPENRPSFDLNPANMGDLDPETRAILEDPDLSGAWWIAEGQEYDERVLQVGWPEMRLRYQEENLYEMSLIAGDSVLQLLVQPVLVGPEREAAEQAYQDALATYQTEFDAWDTQLTNRKNAIRDSFALERQEILQTASNSGDAPLRGKITSRFEVSTFGIWNVDRLLESGAMKVIEKLEDQTGQIYQEQTAYLLDGNKNTVYRFYVGDKTLLEVPPSDDILIWVVDEQDKLAVLRKRTQQTTLMDNAVETLNLELQDILVREPADLRAYLTQER